jgi:hypothetical protein
VLLISDLEPELRPSGQGDATVQPPGDRVHEDQPWLHCWNSLDFGPAFGVGHLDVNPLPCWHFPLLRPASNGPSAGCACFIHAELTISVRRKQSRAVARVLFKSMGKELGKVAVSGNGFWGFTVWK